MAKYIYAAVRGQLVRVKSHPDSPYVFATVKSRKRRRPSLPMVAADETGTGAHVDPRAVLRAYRADRARLAWIANGCDKCPDVRACRAVRYCRYYNKTRRD